MIISRNLSWAPRFFLLGLAATCFVYWQGLYGDWFFDDTPNIVSNTDLQPQQVDTASLLNAALSSPSSTLKRPLASLSFVANYLLGGLAPFGWKLTNLAIHLLNGWLVFLLGIRLLALARQRSRTACAQPEMAAALIATGWLLLPVNVSAVLHVVQRMEMLANLCVLAGLLGYVIGRQRMIDGENGFRLCAASVIGGVLLGLASKETAILLPLYAVLLEYLLLPRAQTPDRQLAWLFGLTLLLPALVCATVLLPWLANPATWASREFSLSTRLLSEGRIVLDYLAWILVPAPHALSFHHDNFQISTGLLSPWTTLASFLALAALAALAWHYRERRPLLALGIAWYFACHLLTSTALPLELIFEHRNYFASFGILLGGVPLLLDAALPLLRVRQALLGILLLWWGGLTFATTYAWGDSMRLAAELALRAPDSARAQTSLGAELLWRANFDQASPLMTEGYALLEQARLMPKSSTRPEQVLIFTNAMLKREQDAIWWQSLIDKLRRRAPSAEDISALAVLTQCARSRQCDLPQEHMRAAFEAAESHGQRNARVLVIHSDYAWNVLVDRPLALALTVQAIDIDPGDSDSRIALARMHLVLGQNDQARLQLRALERLNRMGRLDRPIAELRKLIELRSQAARS